MQQLDEKELERKLKKDQKVLITFSPVLLSVLISLLYSFVSPLVVNQYLDA